MLCPGKIVLEAGLPNTSSKYAAEGTAAHQVLTWALQEERAAAAYIGRVIEADGFVFEVDEDMAGHVQVCVDYVADLKGDDGVVFADERVNYSKYLNTPESEAWGTADVIIARGTEIIVVDFKYGRGVEVDAEKNPQMMLYALGALQAYHGLVADFEQVRVAISQPRVKSAPSEWDCSVDELEAWGHNTARDTVNTCINAQAWPEVDGWAEVFVVPGEKQCKFCRAKATCPSLRNEVTYEVAAVMPATPQEFADLVNPTTDKTDAHEDYIGVALSKVDLIEDWCKAIRAEAERRLLAGAPVPGYKLVQGKRGNRAWSNPTDVEALLKSMRVKIEDMYDFKLISPASAEKLAKAEVIGKRQWPKLQELITQSEGKPHVAPESDSRPALTVTPVVDDFTDVTVDSLA
jgi:hypothetical protein